MGIDEQQVFAGDKIRADMIGPHLETCCVVLMILVGSFFLAVKLHSLSGRDKFKIQEMESVIYYPSVASCTT